MLSHAKPCCPLKKDMPPAREILGHKLGSVNLVRDIPPNVSPPTPTDAIRPPTTVRLSFSNILYTLCQVFPGPIDTVFLSALGMT
jgi:hypothetical protein